jgi:hypothetical protein
MAAKETRDPDANAGPDYPLKAWWELKHWSLEQVVER